MMIELILICVLLLTITGAVYFSLRVVRISIQEAKPNLTININQIDNKPRIDEISDLLENLNNFLNTKDIKKIERKKPEDDGDESDQNSLN